MLAIYKSSGTKASVSQILLASCLAIILPALALAMLTSIAIEKEVALHIKYFEGSEISQDLENQQTLTRFGKFLRKNSFPGTHSETFGNYAQSSTEKVWIENLHDAEAAITYAWGAVLLVACTSFGLLAMNMHRAFQRLSLAVDQLNRDRADTQIEVSGPADIRDLSAGLESLRVKLQDEERLQQQFLRHISHEIKTPLTSIKEGSKLLDEQLIGAMNQEQQEIAKILVKSSDDLQGAIESLLNYNAAVAVGGKKRRRPVALKDLVEQALAKHELTIRNNQLSIKSELDESISSVDSAQMLTVFDNLISNAIKHSPNTGIINLWLQRKKGNKVGFIVKDQGPGVPTDEEEAIFEPFYVGEQSSRMPLRGTGLGLSIARQYIDDHDGELKLLKSRSGAAFQMTLPSAPNS